MKGLGTDILEIERIRSTLAKQGDAFVSRILTEKEKAYCLSHQDPAPSIAARFSAKEAIVKALGCGLGAQVGWHDIEITHDPMGKPVVTLTPHVMETFKNPQIMLSISHSRELVLTVATWIG